MFKKLALIGIGILTVVGISLTAQTDSQDLRDLLKSDVNCQQVCILGIEPGITTRQEVETIFTNEGVLFMPILSGTGEPVNLNAMFWYATSSLAFSPSNDVPSVVGFDENNVVQHILYQTVGLITTDVFDVFGNPDEVTEYVGANEFTITYMDEGLSFTVDTDEGSDRIAFIVILPNTDTAYNDYNRGSIFETVDEPCPNYGAPPCIAPTAEPNQPPVADAGSGYLCHVVAATDTCQFQLDASGSSDSDGTLVAYQWAYRPVNTSDWLPIDPNVTEYTSPTVFFSPTPGDYEVRVRVRDDDFAEAEAVTSMVVNIKPQVVTSPVLPLCTVDSAGQSCTITLDASATTDPDGTIDRYVWRVQLPDGSRPLQGVTQADDPTWDYTLPSGEHLLYVAAWDNDDGAQAVLVDAVVNIRPVADAGADQTAYVWLGNRRTGAFPYSDPITLDGTDSGDPDGIIFTYEWYRIQTDIFTGTEIRSVIGEDATLEYNAGVTGCVQTIELVVTDNHAATHADRMSVNVSGDGALTPPGGCGGVFTP
jgi:hypothetical protein